MGVTWIEGDYGGISGNNTPSLVYRHEPHTLVWLATHYGTGEPLPSYRRSFISFSFGGKKIEEFDLLACCEGNSLNRAGSATFEDLVTSYDIMDGLYYHGTHFKPNTISFRLVSDGIDENLLQDFLNWFRGGVTRKLILAEHPNRSILARVATPPQLEVLPYEKEIEVTLGVYTHKTSTTLYKGFINLEFTADTPFWIAEQNILTRQPAAEGDIYSGINLYTATEDEVKEILKIVYEDRVPSIELVTHSMHFGSDLYAFIGDDVLYTLIALPCNPLTPTVAPENWDTLSLQDGYFIYEGIYYVGAAIDGSVLTPPQAGIGRLGGPVVREEEASASGIIPFGTHNYNMFYGGTAPTPATIEFSVTLSTDSNGYIDCISNSYVPFHALDGTTEDYNTIIVLSIHKKEFKFTTPNIITSWNKAWKIFSLIEANQTYWNDVAETLRDLIRHPAVRGWAVGIITYLNYATSLALDGEANFNTLYINPTTGVINADGLNLSISLLPLFFLDRDSLGRNLGWSDASFKFDSELNIATGKFSYWKTEGSNENIIADYLLNSPTLYFVTGAEENVGDMMRSNWLIIEDRNCYDENGQISIYSALHPEYAHDVYHNVPKGLKNLKIQYQNRYL